MRTPLSGACPTPPLATLSADVAAFDAADAAVLTRTEGAAEDRDVKLRAAVRKLTAARVIDTSAGRDDTADGEEGTSAVCKLTAAVGKLTGAV